MLPQLHFSDVTFFFVAHFRLATNYVYVAGADHDIATRLDEIYEKCGAFFSARNILPPSKDLLSKLLPALFNITRYLKFVNGQRTSVFFGLTTRAQEFQDGKITVPEHCMASFNEVRELMITYDRECIVNGERLKCGIIFGHTKTVLRLKDDTISLNYQTPLTQSSLTGLVFLL